MKSTLVLNLSDMKPFKFFFIIIVLVIVGCTSSKERQMRKMISNTYTVQGFTDFKEYDSCTLADEVTEQLKIYNSKISWDKGFHDAFKDNYEGVFETTLPKDYIYNTYLFYIEEVAKDEDVIKYLESIKDNHPDIYYQKSFVTYSLTYVGTDESGEKIHNICFGKFDNDGNMVAFKKTGTSKWEIIGDNCSIPDYDYYITSPFQDI